MNNIDNYINSISNIKEANDIKRAIQDHIIKQHTNAVDAITNNDFALLKKSFEFNLEWSGSSFSKNIQTAIINNLHKLDDDLMDYLLKFKPEEDKQKSTINKGYEDNVNYAINSVLFKNNNLINDLKFAEKHHIEAFNNKHFINEFTGMKYSDNNLNDIHTIISNDTKKLFTILSNTNKDENFDFLITSDIYYDNIKKLLSPNKINELTEEALKNINLPLIKFLQSLGKKVDFCEQYKEHFAKIYCSIKYEETGLYMIENASDITYGKHMVLRTIISNDLTNLIIPVLKKYTDNTELDKLIKDKYTNNPKYKSKECIPVLIKYNEYLKIHKSLPHPVPQEKKKNKI